MIREQFLVWFLCSAVEPRDLTLSPLWFLCSAVEPRDLTVSLLSPQVPKWSPRSWQYNIYRKCRLSSSAHQSFGTTSTLTTTTPGVCSWVHLTGGLQRSFPISADFSPILTVSLRPIMWLSTLWASGAPPTTRDWRRISLQVTSFAYKGDWSYFAVFS